MGKALLPPPTMNPRLAQNYVEQSRFVLEAVPAFDKANTRAKLIQPFIDLLGWDLFSNEVVIGFTLPPDTDRPPVDYALYLGNDPVVLIDVVPADRSITDIEHEEIKQALKAVPTAERGLVTNGKRFSVSRQNADPPIATFELADLRRDPGVLELISKQALQSGDAEEIAIGLSQVDTALEQLNDRENAITRRIAGVLTDEFEDEPPLDVDAHAAEFVQELEASLAAHRRVLQSAHVPDEPAVTDKLGTE